MKHANLILNWNMDIINIQMKTIIKYVNQIDFEYNFKSISKSNMQGSTITWKSKTF